VHDGVRMGMTLEYSHYMSSQVEAPMTAVVWAHAVVMASKVPVVAVWDILIVLVVWIVAEQFVAKIRWGQWKKIEVVLEPVDSAG
jgi:phosphatidylserine synthase